MHEGQGLFSVGDLPFELGVFYGGEDGFYIAKCHGGHNIHVQADVVWNTRLEAGLEFRPGAIDEPE